MNTLSVYISGTTASTFEKLDLFEDEKIDLSSSIQEIKDISKLYTDFSKTFKVPASANNNKIFKHYYNVNINGGFNAAERAPSVLSLGNVQYKRGRMRLDDVNMVMGKPDSYSITFFGDTTRLTDKFSEYVLTDLNMSQFDHRYNYDEVYARMSGNTDVIYPLISSERNWRWGTRYTLANSLPSGADDDDIKTYPLSNNPYLPYLNNDNYTGIQYNELLPAVKIMKIIEAIEDEFDITFSRDFFNENTDFNDIYMWGNRDVPIVAADIDDIWEPITTYYIYNSLYNPPRDDIYSQYYLVVGDQGSNWTLTEQSLTFYIDPLPGYESIPFKIRVDNGTEVEYGTGGSVILDSTIISDLKLTYDGTNDVRKDFVVEFKTDEPFSFSARTSLTSTHVKYYGSYLAITEEYDYETPVYINSTSPGTIHLTDVTNTTYTRSREGYNYQNPRGLRGRDTYETTNRLETSDGFFKGVLPNMKVKDFLNGLIKMFNLVVYPIDESNFKVQTLDDFYLDGGAHDISKYVDISKAKVSRPTLYETINYQYEETSTVVGEQFNTENGRGYGDLNASFTYEGGKLDIDIPFENIMWERLSDEASGLITDIYVAKAFEINEKGETKRTKTKPILFYSTPGYVQSSGSIRLLNGEESHPIDKYNICKQSYGINNSQITKTLNFGSDPDTWTAEKLLPKPTSPTKGAYSLFTNYWEDYVADLYNPRRRLFNFSAIIPNGTLTKIQLNDKLVIDDTRYIIDNMKVDLTTGEVDFQLLNEIYTNDVTGVVHASIQTSSPRITCTKPWVDLIGNESTGVDLTYLWTTSGGSISGSTTDSVAIAESAGTYTLQVTDLSGDTDNHTVTITDVRSSPVVTINYDSAIPEISYTAQTIELSSSLSAGYKYVWSTDDGYIVSGETTSAITITLAGTYYLDVEQNNTGCAASDSIVVTTGDLEVPSTPDGLYAVDISATTMTVHWSPSTDDVAVLNYDIYVDGLYEGTTANTFYPLTGLILNETYQIKVRARDTSQNVSPFSALFYQKTGSFDGADGSDGLDAKAVKLVAPSYIIEYDVDGLNPSPATMTLTATTQNVGTPWFKFTGDNIPNDGSYSPGTGNYDTVLFTSPSTYTEDATSEIVIQASDGNQILVANDSVSIGNVKSGSDGYTVILSNDSHTLVTSNVGLVTYTGSGTQVIVYRGSVQLAGITTGTPVVGQYKVTASPTNVTTGTLTAGTPLTVGDHSNMTSDQASIEFTIDIESLQTVTKVQTLSKSIEGQDGSSGTASKTNRLVANTYIITYDQNGVETPANQSIILTGSSQNFTNPYYEFLDEGVTKQNSTSTTYTVTDGDEPIGNATSNWTLNTREGSTVGTIEASDTVSIYGLQDAPDGTDGSDGNDGLNGIDGMTFILTNEAHTLPTTNAGVVTYTNSGTDIQVYEGANTLQYNGVGTTPSTWKVVATPTNVSTGAITDVGAFARVGNHSSMTQSQASISYLITGERADGDPFSTTKIQSLGKSNAGADGSDGNDGIDGLNGEDGADGSDGLDAKTVKLTADNYVIKYNSSGVETPAGQTVTFTATQQGHIGTVYYQFLREGVSKQNSTSATYLVPDGDEPIGNAVVNYTVNTRIGGTGGTVYATDVNTIVGLQDAADGGDGSPGFDSIYVINTNQAHTMPATAAGAVTSYANSGTKIYVYEGTTALNGQTTTPPLSNGTFYLGPPTVTNITAGSRTDSGTYITVNNHSNMTADQAFITYNISGKRADGTDFTVSTTQSFGKSLKGDNGQDGQDGTDGTDGVDSKASIIGYVYYAISQTGAPAKPSATSFTFSTFTFAGLTANWSTSPPTATGGEDYWYSTFTCEEDSPLGDVSTSVTFTNPAKHFAFTELVTFTNLSTSGATIIDGGNITTGNIKSANYVTGTAPYSTSGTLINLTNGQIISENFAVETNGDANFKGDISASVITGSELYGGIISGTSISGGTIDIGNGSFVVDGAGDVYIDDGGKFTIGANGTIDSLYWGSTSQTIHLANGYTDNTGGGGSTGGGHLYFDGNSPGGDTEMYAWVTESIGNNFFWEMIHKSEGDFKFYAGGGTTHTMRFTGAAGDLQVSGNITAYYSDERLKTKIGPISSPLDKIDSLSGFKYRGNKVAKEYGYHNDNVQVGVSAQEVQAVMPEAVSLAPFDVNYEGKTKSGEDYLTVQYDRLVPLLIEGIKELRAEVNELKKRLE